VFHPRSGKGGGASTASGGRGVEGMVEATLAQVLVEENVRGQKGDDGDQVPLFLEVGGVGKKRPGAQPAAMWRQGWRGGDPSR
jgi:hypothetical protein